MHSAQARLLTRIGSRDYSICVGFTTPQESCSQYGNRTPAHDSLNCFYTLLGLPQTLDCALWKSVPGLRRHTPTNSLCGTQRMTCTQLSLPSSFVVSAKHTCICVPKAEVVLLLYSTWLMTGFLFACISAYLHAELCISLDHYTRAQPQIDLSVGLGTDSFEAGQPDGVETTISRSDGVESVRMALK